MEKPVYGIYTCRFSRLWTKHAGVFEHHGCTRSDELRCTEALSQYAQATFVPSALDAIGTCGDVNELSPE
jgi:hypothetical protein